ncbi:protein kinase family protein [Desulfosporosinus sp. Sb-LF]|uniref:protein kinase family protein n=1 Tax=Desulfosporosinus sp. Sb-LF TaxID=2560027 RepID=UPI00107F51DA|nr:protein kinase family protein [Desulfosporosinus sp. Sb-LF]TGE34347.1 protein kinase family protein [Desulfosporosinus sp. Sb-LF]
MVLNLFRRDKLYKPSEQIANYTIEKTIGEGRFGICYQVSQDQKSYILKQLKRGMLKKAGVKARFEEEILRSLHHESVPRFIKKIECEDFYGYVLEFKAGKTFEDIIYLDKHVFERAEIYKVGRQLVEILKYLHSKSIVHRDIRVPNTLYDGQKVNLVDFGLARWINNEKYRADMDFAFLGDFLLHLYYSSFELTGFKKRPWYDELLLQPKELLLLKRLMGVDQRYTSIFDVEQDFHETFEANK